MSTLKSILYDAATSLLESRDRVEARDVVRKARMLHADVFEREQERLVMEAAGRIAKAIMKELSENDQPPLLSLSGLAVPTAIAVPHRRRIENQRRRSGPAPSARACGAAAGAARIRPRRSSQHTLRCATLSPCGNLGAMRPVRRLRRDHR
jgi:hypothetical protein